MPPSPAYPDAVRTTLVWALPNLDVAECVLHWEVAADATIDSAFCTALAGAIEGAYSTYILPKMHTGVNLDHITVQDLRTTPYFTRVVGTPSATGGNTSAALPYQVAAVLSLHTTHAGRSGRGRMFLPGFCEDSNDLTGSIEPATKTAILAFGAALMALTSEAGEDVTWSVLSRLNANIYPIDSVTCDSRWDIQRRRANRRTT